MKIKKNYIDIISVPIDITTSSILLLSISAYLFKVAGGAGAYPQQSLSKM